MNLKRILRHPDYSDITKNNDIAMLRMRTAVRFSDYIRPVCLADSKSLFHNGTNSWVTGWGNIGGETLEEVEVPVIGNRQCDCFYKDSPLKVSENMICAGLLLSGKDSCQGDSGGPMVSQQNSVWILSGVVSYGRGCAQAGYPGVYTRVSRYQSWINSEINSDPPAFIQFSSTGVDADSSFICPVPLTPTRTSSLTTTPSVTISASTPQSKFPVRPHDVSTTTKNPLHTLH
ncbi:hypothetical protein ACEWY4_005220 [Coilia grayii]|uniref:Peptidase S1 domain-containing protein n=1 Tax=Coilia grayii TaxID=363190 RepID=A0ABD1KHP6_9TELE